MRDRIIACGGALVGIAVTGALCRVAGFPVADLPLLGGPVGASAVLLFVVPASPFAQPWPIIGGSTISAVVGVTVGKLLHDPVAAAAVAVSLAILTMSALRCVHPPGGAIALLGAAGGPAIASAGYLFALTPIAVNAVLLVGSGWLFHRLCSRHSYPHRVVPLAATPGAASRLPEPADVDRALADLGDTFDISRSDLDRLLAQITLRTAERADPALPGHPA